MLRWKQSARGIWRSAVPRSVRRSVRTATARRSRIARIGPGHPGGIDRLHVGCGPDNIMPAWWNVDIRAFRGIDESADLTQPWPWRNLTYVYGEHFLEHLTLDDAIRFLSEAHAALQPSGRLRLSTPGLEWVWRTHFDATVGIPPADIVASTYGANRAFYGWGHRFLYSRPMLEHVLRGAGFSDLTFHDFGESPEIGTAGA